MSVGVSIPAPGGGPAGFPRGAGVPAPGPREPGADIRSFRSVFADAARGKNADAAERRARDAAEEFVAITFIQPILKQLRDTSTAWGPFAPGSYEKTFAPLLDAEISKRMVRAGGFPIVDAVARDLLKKTTEAEAPGHG